MVVQVNICFLFDISEFPRKLRTYWMIYMSWRKLSRVLQQIWG